MGFMDKAKKFAQEAQQQAKDGTLKEKAKGLAQQAQHKLDEVQDQFNERQKAGAADEPDGPAVEYDKHGRPIQPEPAGAEVAAEPTAGADETLPPSPATPEAEAVAEAAATVPPPPPAEPAHPEPPVVPAAPPEPVAGDVDRSADEPPKLTGGDPLAG